MKKVVLLQGGMGAEREVSLETGQSFAQALEELGYPYEVIDAKEDLPQRLAETQADVALLALHGKFAEDGIVQGICEYLRLPYTGSGVLASALCMDKLFSKQIFLQNEIPTPKFQIIDLKKISAEDFAKEIPVPLVVKPSREGSSVGITIVKDEKDFLPAVKEAGKYDYHVLVEEFIDGMELTIPILDGKALTAIEIVPKTGFFDYENKYTAGKTEYHLPARLDESTLERCNRVALQVYDVCRIRSYCRVDFRLDQNLRPYVLEVNTLPGGTPTSLVPKSAAHEGIPFSKFIDVLIQSAGLDYEGVR